MAPGGYQRCAQRELLPVRLGHEAPCLTYPIRRKAQPLSECDFVTSTVHNAGHFQWNQWGLVPGSPSELALGETAAVASRMPGRGRDPDPRGTTAADETVARLAVAYPFTALAALPEELGE
jgi:hypothetical protein